METLKIKTLKIKTLYLELTHACNQSCRHCYLDGGIHHVFEEMSAKEIKDILSDFNNQGGKYVIITGGEALVRKDCFEILDYLDSLDLPFTFASNSLMMNDERLEKLSGYRNLDIYFTSLLGSTSEEHKYMCGHDSFQKVFKALDYFDTKGINTYVQITLARKFVYGMESIAEKLSKYKHCFMKITPVASLGIKPECDDIQSIIVPPEEFSSFHSKVEKLKRKYPDKIEDENIRNYNQISNMINDYKDDSLYSLKYGFLAVRPNGDKSFSCNMGNPYVFGNARDGIQVPMDDKFFEYIQVLREAEKQVLEEAKENIIEVDTAVDERIKSIYGML